MGDDRPARYLEGSKVVYRASSLGGCERALVATARSIASRPHPEWFQEVLDEGTAMESVIRGQYADMNGDAHEEWQPQFEGELYVGDINEREVVVRWHADDVLLDDELHGAVLREYKKFRPSTWDKFLQQGVECHANYPWQVAVMMHGLHDMGYYTVCQFVGGKYVDGLITELHDVPLFDPPIPRKAIMQKVARVERMIGEGLDPSEVPCQLRYPCGYWFLHDDRPAPAIVNTPKAANYLAEWLAADDQVRTTQAALDAAKEAKVAATAQLRDCWPDGEKRTEFRLADGSTQLLIRVVTEVKEHTQLVRAHTRDYFQKPRRKDED